METDVKILVRERELACRNAWGDDLWLDRSLPATTSSPQPPPRHTTFLGHRIDDEVTSVIDASAHGQGTSMADDVVTFTTVRAVDRPTRLSDDVNVAAVADQAERARVMARGSRDAILSARQRHALRRSTPQSDTQEADQFDEAESVGPAEAIGPRSDAEVSAAGDSDSTTSEPAFAPETVRTSVPLTRLRSFLRGEIDEQASTETTSTSDRPSHFEHVMMQAVRIKERSTSQQTLGPEIVATEALAYQPAFKDKPVVWDVDPDTLDIGFTRLVDRPKATPDPKLAIAQDQDVVLGETSPRIALYQPNPNVAPQPTVTNSPNMVSHGNLQSADLDEQVDLDHNTRQMTHQTSITSR
jgi:hypothetical protein